MSMLGWWMVQTVVLPVATTFFTTRMTIEAALASKPDVGSSINIIDGLETSSTAIVSLFCCSVDSPLWPGIPTKQSFIPSSSIVSITSSTNLCRIRLFQLKIVFYKKKCLNAHKNVWLKSNTAFICGSVSGGNRSQAEYITDSSTVICGECISVCSQ